MTWTAQTMWRTCLHKKWYRTKDYALGIAKKIEEEKGIKLFVYKCPLCNRYHLTKKERGREYDNQKNI